MASLVVRNLDDRVKNALAEQAARNGRSMEAEVRDILAKSVQPGQVPCSGVAVCAFGSV
ncbi:FitA-like ribbon-helix-helix domain-containing protein [uncultured Corynebacterium sp.]|uniref:FitA-like ribbon-helix-helix domain-containing protein n=1 Tax=uncultured Corynebacterium sp. TaxID=159447 RepID=UPI00345C311D